MPWTLVYCTWFGLTIVAQKYLWCAERVGLVSVALGVGLAVNVTLNLILLPRLGLLGAVLATAAANAVCLVLVMAMSSRLGFSVHRGTWVALALPLLVGLGPWTAALCLAAVGLGVVSSDSLLSREEKHILTAGTAIPGQVPRAVRAADHRGGINPCRAPSDRNRVGRRVAHQCRGLGRSLAAQRRDHARPALN